MVGDTTVTRLTRKREGGATSVLKSLTRGFAPDLLGVNTKTLKERFTQTRTKLEQICNKNWTEDIFKGTPLSTIACTPDGDANVKTNLKKYTDLFTQIVCPEVIDESARSTLASSTNWNTTDLKKYIYINKDYMPRDHTKNKEKQEMREKAVFGLFHKFMMSDFVIPWKDEETQTRYTEEERRAIVKDLLELKGTEVVWLEVPHPVFPADTVPIYELRTLFHKNGTVGAPFDYIKPRSVSDLSDREKWIKLTTKHEKSDDIRSVIRHADRMVGRLYTRELQHVMTPLKHFMKKCVQDKDILRLGKGQHLDRAVTKIYQYAASIKAQSAVDVDRVGFMLEKEKVFAGTIVHFTKTANGVRTKLVGSVLPREEDQLEDGNNYETDDKIKDLVDYDTAEEHIRVYASDGRKYTVKKEVLLRAREDASSFTTPKDLVDQLKENSGVEFTLHGKRLRGYLTKAERYLVVAAGDKELGKVKCEFKYYDKADGHEAEINGRIPYVEFQPVTSVISNFTDGKYVRYIDFNGETKEGRVKNAAAGALPTGDVEHSDGSVKNKIHIFQVLKEFDSADINAPFEPAVGRCFVNTAGNDYGGVITNIQESKDSNEPPDIYATVCKFDGKPKSGDITEDFKISMTQWRDQVKANDITRVLLSDTDNAMRFKHLEIVYADEGGLSAGKSQNKNEIGDLHNNGDIQGTIHYFRINVQPKTPRELLECLDANGNICYLSADKLTRVDKPPAIFKVDEQVENGTDKYTIQDTPPNDRQAFGLYTVKDDKGKPKTEQFYGPLLQASSHKVDLDHISKGDKVKYIDGSDGQTYVADITHNNDPATDFISATDAKNIREGKDSLRAMSHRTKQIIYLSHKQIVEHILGPSNLRNVEKLNMASGDLFEHKKTNYELVESPKNLFPISCKLCSNGDPHHILSTDITKTDPIKPQPPSDAVKFIYGDEVQYNGKQYIVQENGEPGKKHNIILDNGKNTTVNTSSLKLVKREEDSAKSAYFKDDDYVFLDDDDTLYKVVDHTPPTTPADQADRLTITPYDKGDNTKRLVFPSQLSKLEEPSTEPKTVNAFKEAFKDLIAQKGVVECKGVPKHPGTERQVTIRKYVDEPKGILQVLDVKDDEVVEVPIVTLVPSKPSTQLLMGTLQSGSAVWIRKETVHSLIQRLGDSLENRTALNTLSTSPTTNIGADNTACVMAKCTRGAYENKVDVELIYVKKNGHPRWFYKPHAVRRLSGKNRFELKEVPLDAICKYASNLNMHNWRRGTVYNDLQSKQRGGGRHSSTHTQKRHPATTTTTTRTTAKHTPTTRHHPTRKPTTKRHATRKHPSASPAKHTRVALGQAGGRRTHRAV